MGPRRLLAIADEVLVDSSALSHLHRLGVHDRRVVVAAGHWQIGERPLRASSRVALEWRSDRVAFYIGHRPTDARQMTEARRISAGLCPIRSRDPQE